MLEDKILSLKHRLIEYASLIEQMISKTMNGLLKKEDKLLVGVIEQDEPVANNFEIEIDELCTTLIAQYEPRARDLRTVLMILKMNNDLERMGDLTVNISESALYLIERPQVKPITVIPKMAEEVKRMVKDSITSFVKEDVKLARKVTERDNIVDELRKKSISDLIPYMVSDTTAIERCQHLLRITHNLERIADLSTNICEDVIFMVQGRVIKHHLENEKKK